MVKPPWTSSKGQFYTYRPPNKTLWFQRIRQRMGFIRIGDGSNKLSVVLLQALSGGDPIQWYIASTEQPPMSVGISSLALMPDDQIAKLRGALAARGETGGFHRAARIA
jgi:hypothetical protein